ncbi:YscG family type III secretion protein [Shewanella sp. VB17]|uniref:YscG family type III secretion protein n=1 Tax=Shewanella sp. VB17 TaxID=2739432 RepID=UPI00156566F6|nr:YscG family type III secretion protein [Shewanella sp. VB17]NRD71733.1 YscG family type III secretion protein [Shewanella sp. VB17]
MNREIKKLLAELALIAVGQHQYCEAESIAITLEDDEDFIELVATIRALSLMNRAQYQAALSLLEPLAAEYHDLICFVVLCTEQLDLGIKQDFWLNQAVKSSSTSTQTFATHYMALE